jgi:hypothetical protein
MTRVLVRPGALSALAVAAVMVLGACSSSSDDNSSATPTGVVASSSLTSSPAADECAALQTLQDSIGSLLAVQPVQQGAQGVQDALTQVGNDIGPAASAASSELAPQIDALKQAVQAMSDTISNAGTAGAATTATQLASELPAVGTAWAGLTSAAADMNCGLATPSA